MLLTGRIKAELLLREQTYEEFSKEIGVSKYAFTGMMQRKQCSFKKLVLMCRKLGVSSDYLLGLSDNKK